MLQNVPVFVTLIFIATTLSALVMIYKASPKSAILFWACLLWIILQSIIGITEFYTDTYGTPPRFVLLVIPPLLITLLLLFTKRGREYLQQFDLKWLTAIQAVRIPVELCLYWLCAAKFVPQVMTFEGRNFDILTGITALIIYFLISKKKATRTVLILWNIFGLALLFNVVIHAVLSAPTTFQVFAFDQPNVAVLYAPFNLLPGFIVPVALFAHIASLLQLANKS
jgi:hypothetical protein